MSAHANPIQARGGLAVAQAVSGDQREERISDYPPRPPPQSRHALYGVVRHSLPEASMNPSRIPFTSADGEEQSPSHPLRPVASVFVAARTA